MHTLECAVVVHSRCKHSVMSAPPGPTVYPHTRLLTWIWFVKYELEGNCESPGKWKTNIRHLMRFWQKMQQ